MSTNYNPKQYFLYVGVTRKKSLNKLYIGKGSPNDQSCPLWREASKKTLKGNNEKELQEAAKAWALELYPTPEDLSNESERREFNMNISRGLEERPTRRFIVDPWEKRS